MITIEQLEKDENLGDYIYMNDKGAIVVDSRFEKQFDGDFQLLLSCCEDYIYHGYEDDDSMVMKIVVGESIGYGEAIADYKKVMKGRKL